MRFVMIALFVLLGWAHEALAQDAATANPKMAPMDQYLMVCYMMSKQGFGGDSLPDWPPHLMFFYSEIDPAIWGANLPGFPVIGFADPLEHLTQFVIPTQRWSDGTEYLP